MNRATTLPSALEQARHALLLLGTPAPARRVVDVHQALFDGDLDMRALADLMRAAATGKDQPTICYGLSPSLTPLHLALTEWPLEQRLIPRQKARYALFVQKIRIVEFVAM